MIISPKSDMGFKEIFRNPVVLRHFLADVMGIPAEQIRSVRLLNTFLWKRFQNQKLGIMDLLAELSDGSRVNVELQRKAMKRWDKRQIYYLAKLFTSDLFVGEDYEKLTRCVAISILDFNLSEAPEYHRVYRLRDKNGNDFSDILEVHIIELQKQLTGDTSMDGWIQFFNAETEEDLDMIKTNNQGIEAAVCEIRTLSLPKRLRLRYEAHLKEIRDRRAIEAYIREEGIEQGIEQGIDEGIDLTKQVLQLSAHGKSPSEIASELHVPLKRVQKILE